MTTSLGKLGVLSKEETQSSLNDAMLLLFGFRNADTPGEVGALLEVVANFDPKDLGGGWEHTRTALRLLKEACLRDPQQWGAMVSVNAASFLRGLAQLVSKQASSSLSQKGGLQKWTAATAERRDYVLAAISCLMAAVTGSESRTINFASKECCAASSWIVRGE